MGSKPSSQNSDLRRQIPSVAQAVQYLQTQNPNTPASELLWAVRQSIQNVKTTIASQQSPNVQAEMPTKDDVLKNICLQAHKMLERPLPFAQVINATGVVLHTQLGRAPLCPQAQAAVMAASQGYLDLEIDLDTGMRKSRLRHVGDAVMAAIQAGQNPKSLDLHSNLHWDALAVNNNAAALLLALRGMLADQPIVIGRNHILEIGGGFRILDILAAGGISWVEVGTSNRTYLSDYAQALEQGAGGILWVHPSNFTQHGYTHLPSAQHVAKLAAQMNKASIMDLGSGALQDARSSIDHPATVLHSLAAGFLATTFSADKLLGGPQAGIVVAQDKTIAKLKSHPLARALRCDKLTLAALLATLQSHARGTGQSELPALSMLDEGLETLWDRAQAWQTSLGAGHVMAVQDAVGGGAMPDRDLEGAALVLSSKEISTTQAAQILRTKATPILAQIAQDRIWLHPRTVAVDQEAAMLQKLASIKWCVHSAAV